MNNGEINRRVFVGGAAATIAVTGLGFQPGKVFAQSQNQFLETQTAVIARAIGNVFNTRDNPSTYGMAIDLFAASDACTQVANYLRDTGMDAQLTSGYASIRPESISLTTDPAITFAALSPYIPNLTLDYVTNQPRTTISQADMPGYLAGLQQHGLAHYMDAMAISMWEMGDGFAPELHVRPMEGSRYDPTPASPPEPTGYQMTQPAPQEGGGVTPAPLTPQQKREAACKLDNKLQLTFLFATALQYVYCSSLVVSIPICTETFTTFLVVASLHWAVLHVQLCGW